MKKNTQLQPSSPLTSLKGVGPKVMEKLEKLGLRQVTDLLLHFPLRYEDRTRLVKLALMEPGKASVFQGQVVDRKVVFGRRRSLQVLLQDDTGTVVLRFFHFNASQQAKFEMGQWIRCVGEPALGRTGFELYHPENQRIAHPDAPLEGVLTAHYPLTEGVSQGMIRKWVREAFDRLNAADLEELLPLDWLEQQQWPSLYEALRVIHFPEPDENVQALSEKQHPAHLRFAFEELLAHSVSRHEVRETWRQRKAPQITLNSDMHQRFLSHLPFELTQAQHRVLAEALPDLAKPSPSLRLIQGDVGSGKTLVAALAALQVVCAGYQVAVLAPTEILASQHLINFQRWFEPLGICVGLLTGRLTAKEKREAQHGASKGELQIIVGTQALFQEAVAYQRLGLIISDEQHRFGVNQRLQLLDKHSDLVPHQLMMTATPIPRTLAMVMFNDIDVSVIDELPPGRQAIETTVINATKQAQVISRLSAVIESGVQVYWVCTLVEESEHIAAQDAQQRFEQLCEQMPQVRIGLLHGRMKAPEKAEVMAQFRAHQLDLLVSTTVIEVGVDVPNASIMVIENAERLGLSQLHQLRGRVGRGSKKSYCLLMHGDTLSSLAKQRLAILKDSNDGFKIAEEDLKIRGPGEVLGLKQTGELQFKMADLGRHQHLLEQSMSLAKTWRATDPERCQRIVKRWFSHSITYAFV
ncbi:MAG: ATP-dependent DNA helicase RecG [Pseudomonadota bacterium]|nr:ATP-dependent DNA helicase RecG [Pseudomonadota bacterium]